MSIEVLETRVRMVNNTHKYGNDLYYILIKAFKPFIGKKIIKKAGGLIQKAQQIINSINSPYNGPTQVYKNPNNNYSLSFIVKTCETLNERTFYYEICIYIGNVENEILKDMDYPFPDLKVNYKAESVIEDRRICKELQEKADNAKSALFPFGMYDR